MLWLQRHRCAVRRRRHGIRIFARNRARLNHQRRRFQRRRLVTLRHIPAVVRIGFGRLFGRLRCGAHPVAAAFPEAREKVAVLLHLQLGVDVVALGAGARLQEALFEVVAEEGVQHGIHGRIGVAQAADQDENGDFQAAGAAGRRIDEGHLRRPVREPAENVDGDNGED